MGGIGKERDGNCLGTIAGTSLKGGMHMTKVYAPTSSIGRTGLGHDKGINNRVFLGETVIFLCSVPHKKIVHSSAPKHTKHCFLLCCHL